MNEHEAWDIVAANEDLAQRAAWKLRRPIEDVGYELGDFYVDAICKMRDAVMGWDESRGHVRAFLTVAAKRGIIDGLRQVSGYNRRENYYHLRALSLDDTGGEGDRVLVDTNEDQGAAEALEDVDVRAAFQRVTDTLSTRDREILVLRVDGLAYAAIADRYGLTESRICQIIGQVRKLARRALQVA